MLKRILLWSLILILTLIIGAGTWYYYIGATWIRHTLLEQLRPIVGSSLNVKRLDLHLNGVTLEDFSLDLAPRTILEVQAVNVRIAYLKLLKGGINLDRAIDDLNLVKPRLILLPGKKDSTKKWKFKPYPLKPFSKLKFLHQIRIDDASIEVGKTGENVIGDSISGVMNFTDMSEVTLNMVGRVVKVPDVKLKIDASADFIEGSFQINTNVNIDDLSKIPLPGAIADKLLPLGGEITAHMEIIGADFLGIGGQLNVKDAELNYDNLLFLRNGQLNGYLLDPMVDIDGQFELNGIMIPFKAEINDLFTMEWKAVIEPTRLDLSQFDHAQLGMPTLDGEVDLKLSLSSHESNLIGEISLVSDSLRVDGVIFDSLNLKASIKDNILKLERMLFSPLGAQAKLDGSHNFNTENTTLNWLLKHNWEADTTGWCQITHPILASKGKITGTAGYWNGGGDIQFSDSNGNRLLNGIINLEGKQGNLIVQSMEKLELLQLSVLWNNEQFSYKLFQNNLHSELRNIVSNRYIPDRLDEFSIHMELDGSIDENEYKLSWKSDSLGIDGSSTGKFNHIEGGWSWDASLQLDLPDNRSLKGEIGGEYNSGNTDQQPDKMGGDWIWNTSLQLNLPNKRSLNGVINGEYSSGLLNLKQTTIRNRNGDLLFNSKVPIQLSTETLLRTDGKLPVDNLSIEIDSLPVARILEFIFPDLVVNHQMIVSGQIEAISDTIYWKGQTALRLPDSVAFDGFIAGWYTPGRFFLQNFIIEEGSTQQLLFKLVGDVDLSTSNIDSLILITSNLPIERILHFILPEQASLYSGMINGRMSAKGKISSPELTLDMHMTSGQVRNVKGYWANLNISTQDSLYWINNFGFGRGVSSLMDLSGLVGRYDHSYDLGIVGRGVDVQSIMRTVTGKPGPLSGVSNFAVTMESNDQTQLASANIIIEANSDHQGKIGPMEFDRITTMVHLSGVEQKKPVIEVESIDIDWGNVQGKIIGTIPLTIDQPLEISGSIHGEIMELLRRISPYFNQARGSGHLKFDIGGDISHPVLNRGQFVVNNGKMEIKHVVEKIEKINVKIDIDSSGHFNINQFNAQFDENPLSISNSFPSNEDLVKPLKFFDYNLGVLNISTGSKGVWMVIPGIMEDSWGGYVKLLGHGGGAFQIRGPVESPWAVGEVRMRSAVFTYPLLRKGGKKIEPTAFTRSILDYLKKINWDVRIIPERGCRYILEMSQLENTPLKELTKTLPFVDVKLLVDLQIDDDPDGLMFTGSIQDTLHLQGELESHSGDINFLDLEFNVDEMSILFNPADLNPLLQGKAYTIIPDTSTIIGEREIRLRLKAGNTSNDETVSKRAGFDDMSIVLEDDQQSTQEEILKLLGYSPGLLLPKLGELGRMFIEEALPIKEWSRMLEQKAKRLFGIDRLAVESSVAKNIIEWQYNNSFNPDSADNNYNYLRTLDQSRVTVGKYLTRDLYLSYSGVLQSALEDDVTRLGVIHDWSLQLRLSALSPNLRINCQYLYDGLTKKDNIQWSLRYGFYFDFARRVRPKWLLD